MSISIELDINAGADMLESNVINRIRHIFLQPRPHVSISPTAHLLGWTSVIEKALDDDADRVLPHALRTAELRVRPKN